MLRENIEPDSQSKPTLAYQARTASTSLAGRYLGYLSIACGAAALGLFVFGCCILRNAPMVPGLLLGRADPAHPTRNDHRISRLHCQQIPPRDLHRRILSQPCSCSDVLRVLPVAQGRSVTAHKRQRSCLRFRLARHQFADRVQHIFVFEQHGINRFDDRHFDVVSLGKFSDRLRSWHTLGDAIH
jgi:hypothetical protein